MTTWFSATAVIPQLREEWSLGQSGAAWLTIAVQLGFVAGALVSALLTLPDVVSPRRSSTPPPGRRRRSRPARRRGSSSRASIRPR
jgi:hypothetical protein